MKSDFIIVPVSGSVKRPKYDMFERANTEFPAEYDCVKTSYALLSLMVRSVDGIMSPPIVSVLSSHETNTTPNNTRSVAVYNLIKFIANTLRFCFLCDTLNPLMNRRSRCMLVHMCLRLELLGLACQFLLHN